MLDLRHDRGDARGTQPSVGELVCSGMTDRARKLLHDAMELSLSERAELVADLLATFDGEPDADVEAAWAAEIERRARESPDNDVPWETVSAEMISGTSS